MSSAQTQGPRWSEPADTFWAPRLDQLRAETLPTIWDRLERQGVVDNFRRVVGLSDAPRRAMHFSDSDLYKWIEAAALAGGAEGMSEAVDLVERSQHHDGYVGTYYGQPELPARYSDLTFGHEHYCIGHLMEAAVAHERATGSAQLLEVAQRAADHLLATFGAGRDQRTDAHPEVELALCRLAGATGTPRYVDHAAWVIERQLEAAGLDLGSFRLGGHAVRALYLTSGIAEVALATGDATWTAAAERLFESLLAEHSYPTGAVGGRWLGESVGRPYEQPDQSAYAESCAAVAAAQLSWRIWQLSGDPRALDHLEPLLFNAVPCGVGGDGRSWFYSQPHAVDEVAAEENPWVYEFDYGQMCMREWFPVHRHEWFDVPCCPPNLARMFGSLPTVVAECAGADLMIHLPLAGRIVGCGWDVELAGEYPVHGGTTVTVHAAPPGGKVMVRRPGWAGGHGHVELAASGHVDVPVSDTWWTSSHRVGGGGAFVRRGPVVLCAEGVDSPDVDLRDVLVDPRVDPADGFFVASPPSVLHQLAEHGDPSTPPRRAEVVLRPYADWANRGPTTMRTRFPTGQLSK